MSASDPLQSTLLKLFAEAAGHQLKTSLLKSRLATASKKAGSTHDPEAIDEALTVLIDDGKIAVTGAHKGERMHPKKGGTYFVTSEGREHIKPEKPDGSDETLAFQESYILLQMIRFAEHTTTRTKLNDKLKTESARQNLEFPGVAPLKKGEPRPETKAEIEVIKAQFIETMDYHLHNLVRAGSLEEKHKGNSTSLTLTNDGLKALGAADQHETVEFRFQGAALNFLLRVARDSSAKHRPEDALEEPETSPEPAPPVPNKSPDVEPKQIHDYVAQLKADKYAGRTLVPIHEVRSLVARHHGDHAASHPVFDRLLKVMRSEGEIKIIAIADSRDTPQHHLDDSIPGMNETLFFIDTE